jgi:threonyl-tRNA synthetase
VQTDVLSVADRHVEYAREVIAALRAAGYRTEGDFRNEKLGYKIRESQLKKVPYALVIGDREVEGRQISPRRRGGEQIPPMSVGEFLETLRKEAVNPAEQRREP